MLGFVFFFHEEAAYFTPNVPSFDAVVVQHVGRAVYRDTDFFQVGVDVFFRVPCPRSVRLNKQEEDGFHGPPLGVHFDVYSRVCSFVNRDYFVTAHMVVDKLFSAGVNAACLVCKGSALDHFILELDVRQLVLQLGCV